MSFGIGVITPRWLYVLAAATPRDYGDPLITDETLEPLDPRAIARRRRRRHRHPYGQRAARLRDRRAGARRGRHGRVRRHSRHALSRRRRTSSAARTRSSRATATSSGARCSTTARAGRCSAIYDGGRVEPERSAAGALGPDAARPLHVGVGADGARLPEALLVLFGLEDRRPAPAPARERRGHRARSSSCGGKGFRFIALADDNFYPVTLDRSARWRRAARTRRTFQHAERDSRRALRADGPAGGAAGRHGVLHADHDGSRRGSGVPRRDAARRASRARSSASSR